MAKVDHQNTWALRVCAKKIQLNRRTGAEVRTGPGAAKTLSTGSSRLRIWPCDKQEVPDLDVCAGVISHAPELAPLTCDLG